MNSLSFRMKALSLTILLCNSTILFSAPGNAEETKRQDLPLGAIDLLLNHIDYAYFPFAADSVWKTPIGTEAAYADRDDAESVMLRNSSLGWPWIQDNAMGVYVASSSDPVRVWNYAARPGNAPEWPYEDTSITNGSISIPTPDGIEFLGTTDRHAVIVSIDHTSAIEIWHGAYDSKAETYSADFIAYMDLTGSGISPTDGLQISIRAYGGSLIGGLVFKNELKSGWIKHPVAMTIAPTQLEEGEIMTGYTSRRDMSTQKVWPASTTDGLGWNSYSGLIPMGSLWALPADTDLSTLGLQTKEGLALARAYKYYGGYVVDAATSTTSIVALEADCTDEQIENLQTDKRVILNHLVMITNNSEEHPGGPGERLIDTQGNL